MKLLIKLKRKLDKLAGHILCLTYTLLGFEHLWTSASGTQWPKCYICEKRNPNYVTECEYCGVQARESPCCYCIS